MCIRDSLLEFCNYYGVPCLVSDKTTSALMAEIIRWLNVKLAPCISCLLYTSTWECIKENNCNALTEEGR